MAGNFYTVKKGDTLSSIAYYSGTTVQNLKKINGIKNADQIDVGQRIALKAEAVCKVEVLLLDLFFNPIPGAKMRLDYNGKSEALSTGKDGKLPSIMTETPDDTIGIFIARLDGTWKQITEIVSGFGNKLVTLRSPKLKIPTKTMPHPQDANGKPVPDPGRGNKKPVKPPVNPKSTKAKGAPLGDFGDSNGPKAEITNDENGFPVTIITNDQAELDFLRGYTGEKITEADYEAAARELGCEVAAIKAVAEVESGSLGAFDKKQRPSILYERHLFSYYTNEKYNKINPDISRNKPYTNKKVSKDGTSNKSSNLYGHSYERLAKAYLLNQEAALKSCSWGKFQILGGNYEAAGFKSAKDYVKSMCISEREHLKAFLNFINADKGNKE